MAKRFTRNITDTKLTGKNIEPFETNIQNDLLSDDKHVYVRNGNKYDCLTNSITSITSKDKSIKVTKRDRTIDLSVIGGGSGGTPTDINRVVDVKSESKYIEIEEDKESTEEEKILLLKTEKLNIELKELIDRIKNIENNIGTEVGFIGNVTDMEFNYFTGNTEEIYTELDDSLGYELVMGERYTKEVGKNIVTFKSNHKQEELEINAKDTMYTENSMANNYWFEFRNNSKLDVKLNFDKYGFIGTPIYANKLEYQNGDIIIKANTITKVQLSVYRDDKGKPVFTFIQEIKG